jgi:hypothetical protein
MVIWRAEITPNLTGSKICYAQLPAGSQLLSAGFWKGGLCVWAQVDPTEPIVPVPVLVIPTGIEHEKDGSDRADRLVGRVEVGGEYIFHLFTVKPEREN